MTHSKVISEFAEELQASIEKGEFVKLLLQRRKNKGQDIQNLELRKKEDAAHILELIYHYKDKAETAEHGVEEIVNIITSNLGKYFLEGYLYTTHRDMMVKFNKKGVPKSQTFKPTYSHAGSADNDTRRKAELDTRDNEYLLSLQITDQRGEVVKNMKSTFEALNNYIQIIDNLVEQANLPDKIKVVEIGRSVGHFTFALYDYFVNILNKQVEYKVWEKDENLVKFYNNIAEKCHFTRLSFELGNFEKADIRESQVVVAMFSSDQETDVVLAQAIKSQAELFIGAPYKDANLTGQLRSNEKLGDLLKFDLLLNKQANVISNGMRTLLLQSNGYRPDVQEFVAPDYPQNDLLLAATRDPENTENKDEALKFVKERFELGKHHLEELLEK